MGKIINIDVAYGIEKVHLYESYKVATLNRRGEAFKEDFETEIIVLGESVDMPDAKLAINARGKTQFINQQYLKFIKYT